MLLFKLQQLPLILILSIQMSKNNDLNRLSSLKGQISTISIFLITHLLNEEAALSNTVLLFLWFLYIILLS